MGQSFAIHQPNLFPWMGYFNRISQVETFIFFDHVALPGGRTIVQRVKVLGPKGPTWLTMPIEKSGQLGQKICETKLRDPEKSFQELVNKLEAYYRRAPHFREVMELVRSLAPQSEFLADFNCYAIEQLSRAIGLNTSFVRSSASNALMASESIKTEMIIETCQVFGVTDYVSGKGCLDFLEPELFAQAGIELRFQEFSPESYHQFGGEFEPGLSLLDALFFLGCEQTKEVVVSSSLALSC